MKIILSHRGNEYKNVSFFCLKYTRYATGPNIIDNDIY